jgi:hypothetical protein
MWTTDMSKRQIRLADSTLPLFLSVIAATAILYAVWHRTFSEFIVGVSVPAIVLTMGWVGSALAAWRRWTDWKEIAGYIILVLIIVPIISIFYYSVGVFLKDLWLWTRTLPSDTTAKLIGSRALVGVGTLGFGAALFWFRLRMRAIYGTTEVVVAIVIALAQTRQHTLSSLATNPQLALALLTASLYLVVRGLDNIHHGIYKDPPDQFARGLFQWMRRVSPKIVEVRQPGPTYRDS